MDWVVDSRLTGEDLVTLDGTPCGDEGMTDEFGIVTAAIARIGADRSPQESI